jgi:outer membrane protein assembly complex protein YaeT
VGIRLQCDAHLSLDAFQSSIIQKVGEPLDQSRVSESLKKLYATGRFTDLRAEAQPREGGVELVFVGRAQYFVGIVQVEGTPGALEPRTLVTASRLRLGQPLSEQELAVARQHLVDLLVANAYYQARVEYRVLRDGNTQEAGVVFSVASGKRARLSGVEFRNHAVFPPERLAAVAGWRSGTQLTSARVERGLFKVHQFYVARGHLQATASILKRVYDPKLNTEKLLVQAEAGPQIRVRVEGGQVGAAKLKELLPVFRDGVIDDPALARCAAILEDYFEQQGFFSASVRALRESHADAQKLDLTFRVLLGQRGEFVGYGVNGNRHIPTTQLMAVISSPSQGLFHPPPTFSRELLERKVNALTTLYHARGFLEVRVTPIIDDRFQHQPGHRFVTLEIAEGPQTTIQQLRLLGVGPDTEKKLWAFLISKPTRPFSPERAQADRDAILSFLADRGYTHATVSWHTTPVATPHEVDLEYRIEPGPQEWIQQVVVLGNQHTRARTISGELLIRKDQPLSQSALQESQRQLHELGIFNQVQISTQDRPAPAGPDEKQTVLVGVEESRRWTLGYGGGLEVQRLGSNNPQGQFKASPRVSLDVSRLNVGGLSQTLTLRARLSDIEKGGGLNYLIPRFLGHRDLSLRINGLVDQTQDVLTFTADRREGSVSIEKRLSPRALLLGRYTFRRVQALDISSRVQPAEVPILSQASRVGAVGISYVNDSRDDPADATRGSYSVADAEVAWRNFGSEANFPRFSGHNSTYYRLGSRLVFARSTRFGVQSPFGGLREVRTAQGQVLWTHEIPLPEQFFMGGSESHRGFSINQAGPRDPVTGYPIGGNALFLNSLELRMPLAERRLGFALFHDAGNVFSTIREMRLLKFTQSSPTDFNYTVHAVGCGVRYKTPVGPLRFDVGYNLNPSRFQVVTQQNGMNVVDVQRLSQFQYFLSVGQSF